MKRHTGPGVASAMAALIIGIVAPARGQSAQADPGVTVGFFGGATSGASATGVAAGGSVLVDLSEWIAIEGDVVWSDRGRAADAVMASASLIVNLQPLGSPLVPYAVIGGGVYHASFDLADPRFLGPIGPQYAAGTQFCASPGTSGPGPGGGFGPRGAFGPGTGTCPNDLNLGWGVGTLHDFYARRLGVLTIPAGLAWGTESFTDPSLDFGGGVRFDVTDHLIVRPDARAIVVFAEGDTYTVGRFGIHVGYRF